MKIKHKGLVCLFSLCIATTSYASTFVTKNYEFLPSVPLAVDNPLWWQANLHCVITTVDKEDILMAIMKKKEARVNGLLLKEGEQTSVVVRNQEQMTIVADAGARIEIINTGSSIVKAKCTT